MTYTKKTPWTLILGIIMVGFAYLVIGGHLEALIKTLSLSKFIRMNSTPPAVDR